MLTFFKCSHEDELTSSQLYNNETFYAAFENDLRKCKQEMIIECPFITANRVASLLPIFKKMRSRGVRTVINTKPIYEHPEPYASQAQSAIEVFQDLGITVLFTGNHHRKIAIIDRKTLWEGSLNILSQNDSCEVMRRIQSSNLCEEMINFISLRKFLS
jgi:hypothetical protein